MPLDFTYQPGTKLRNFNQHERHIIGGGAAAPGRNTFKDLPFHLRQRQVRSIAGDLREATDTQHFPLEIEILREPIRVDKHAVSGFDG